MGRLIDADALIARTYEAEKNVVKSSDISKMVMDAIRNEVNNQPTAYDVEKVVAELQEMIDHNVDIDTGEPCNNWVVDMENKLIKKAIDIVYKGGKE